MPTPHVIENTGVTGFVGTSFYDFGPNQDLGPWPIGSKRYVAYLRAFIPPGPSPNLLYTAVAFSTDGIDFACQDHAHAPQLLSFGGQAAACLGNDGVTIYLAYAPLSGGMKIVPFNTGTNLYGTVISGGPAVTTNTIISSIRMLSTGVLAIMYGVNESASDALRIVTCTTLGVWGTPQVIATDSGSVHKLGMSSVPDPVGRTHILYMSDDVSFHGPKQLRYARFDGATVSGDTLIEQSIFNNFYQSQQGTGRYDAANDRVLFPYQFNYQSVNSGNGLILVNAASTAPAIVEDIVQDYNQNFDYFGVAISADGSTYVFTYENYTTTEQLVQWTRPANSPGAWTGPTNFWNYDTDPPPPDITSPPDPTIEQNPSSGLVPLLGGYGTLISFFGGGGGGPELQICNTIYYMEEVSPPPTTGTLELTKIISGGPAMPGDFTLTAVGGTDTISGAGHVGPTEVTADTYELSEVDSSGSTWGDSTWGESTWGGDYVPGPWDCGDATMPTATSVIVPPGGTVACFITNTFEGPTPPPPPPPAGNDAVGCFELIRVDCTLMPARHLPTRGSVK